MKNFWKKISNSATRDSVIGTMSEAPADAKYRAGQVWSYHTRAQESDSTFTVVKVESSARLGILVHISLQGLKLKNARHPSGWSDTIAHMPFSQDAIDGSIETLISENVPLPDFEQGYALWKQAFDAGKGGVFTIPVAEGVQAIEESMN